MQPISRLALLAMAGALSANLAWAEVTVSEPWARATVPTQKSSGVFLTLQASSDSQLLGVSTPLAGVAELHEMTMEGDVMRMRAIQELPLPAHQTVALRPGGYHVMLMDLKQQLKAGDTLPLTLKVREQGQTQPHEITLQVPVRALGAAAPAAQHEHEHEGHGAHDGSGNGHAH